MKERTDEYVAGREEVVVHWRGAMENRKRSSSEGWTREKRWRGIKNVGDRGEDRCEGTMSCEWDVWIHRCVKC